MMEESALGPRTINAYAALSRSSNLQRWRYESRPLGDEDVEVQVSHCALAGYDVERLDDMYGDSTFPLVVGHEIAGTVTAAGPSVKNLAVGDRAGVGFHIWSCRNENAQHPCSKCAKGDDLHCPRAVFVFGSKYQDGARTYGGLADYVRLRSDYAVKIPDTIPPELAAPLMCAGLTVFSPLKRHVRPGSRVGVVGIGGLGHLALQFVRALGGTPIALSYSPNKREEAIALGGSGTEFVDLSDSERLRQAADSLDLLLVTGVAPGRSYDLALVRNNGTVVVLCVAEEPRRVRGKRVTITGSITGSLQDTRDMLATAAEHNVRPMIEKMPMAAVNDGLQRLRSGKARYCVVLEN